MAGNGETVEEDFPLDPLHTNGKHPELIDEVRGIAAVVSRIDRELEGYREVWSADRKEREEQKKLFAQMSLDIAAHKVAMDKVADLLLKEFQKRLAIPDPMKPV